MKRILHIAVFTTALVMTAALLNTSASQGNEYYEEDNYYEDDYRDGEGSVSYQTFYDELSPYGRWVDYPGYGYVWVPNAGRGFRPYSTNGHWVYTRNYEWMWVSDYSWGWAPFHYGRWFYDPFYGWVWVPGYEWSPAWVVWRGGGDYYGWAPIRPGIHISIGFSIGSYSPPYDYWCFAPRRYITSPRLHNYYFDRSRNVTIINQTTIINNYNYSRNVFRTGPSRMEAERYAGRITPVRFRESSRPGRTQFRNNEVAVYRPRVQQDADRRFSPRNVERYEGNATNDRVSRGNNLPRRDANIERRDPRIERRDPRIERRDPRIERRDPRIERRDPRMERRNAERPGQGRIERPSDRPNERIRQPQSPARGQDRVRPNDNRSRQMERPQQQPRRQMESRPPGNYDRQVRTPAPSRERTMQRPPQMERRQAQPQQRMERREVESRSQGNGNGNGGGQGKGRGRGGS